MGQLTANHVQGLPDLPPDAEVELRFSLPPHLVDVARVLLIQNGDYDFSEACVLYTDNGDIRCVNGEWQRKRAVASVRMPCVVRCTLSISVESPAMPADKHYKTIYRRRWSKRVGQYMLDLTESTRNCNLEVEYCGELSKIGDSIDALDTLLRDVVPFMVTCTGHRGARCLGGTGALPFVRIPAKFGDVGAVERERALVLMQQNQPISLRKACPAISTPLVSLKYDGTRVALFVMRHRNQWIASAVCRRGEVWSVPCSSACEEAILDCEYMARTREFVAFDMYQLRGRPVTGDYRARLHLLAAYGMPQLACGLTMRVKSVYPLATLTPEWYSCSASDSSTPVDGIIVHDGTSVLGRPATMYKWKPVHTVDLLVGECGDLVDRKFDRFLYACPNHGKVLVPGQLWECSFTSDGNFVVPMFARTDKTRANPRVVCNDVRQAHSDAIGIDDMKTQLTKPAPVVRRNKRGRGA